MSLIKESDDESLAEECIDELEDLVISNGCYRPAAIATWLGTYL